MTIISSAFFPPSWHKQKKCQVQDRCGSIAYFQAANKINRKSSIEIRICERNCVYIYCQNICVCVCVERIFLICRCECVCVCACDRQSGLYPRDITNLYAHLLLQHINMLTTTAINIAYFRGGQLNTQTQQRKITTASIYVVFVCSLGILAQFFLSKFGNKINIMIKYGNNITNDSTQEYVEICGQQIMN